MIESFELGELNEELAARRRGDVGQPASLRDLVDHFNRQVLRSAITDAGESPLEGEVENLYRLLTDDDVGGGTRIRARKQLERDGVDFDAVQENFVSHPTMGSHLENCLGVEKAEVTEDRIETARERIFKMQGRAEAVIENTLDGLAAAGRIAAGELVVMLHVRVTCEECGVHADIGTFIDDEGCDCERE